MTTQLVARLPFSPDVLPMRLRRPLRQALPHVQGLPPHPLPPPTGNLPQPRRPPPLRRHVPQECRR